MNKRLRGYTLIELMISLLLGLLLISGFGSLFSQTQKNAAIQRSLSYMMADGRYILEVFGRELRRAGSLSNRFAKSNGAPTSVFKNDPQVLGSTMDFVAGDYIKGEYNAAGFGTADDKPFNVSRLAIRYQLFNNTDLAASGSGSNNSPCESNILLTNGEYVEDLTQVPTTQRHVVTLYFYVALDASKIPTLYCVAKRDNLETNFNVTSAPVALISNVQKLFITYGIDTDGDALTGTCYNSLAVSSTCASGADGTFDEGAANYYVDANSIGNTGQPTWQQVVSAKLSVVLRSDDDNLTDGFAGYTVDDAAGPPFIATDHRFYRVSSTAIAFRNISHNLIIQ